MITAVTTFSLPSSSLLKVPNTLCVTYGFPVITWIIPLRDHITPPGGGGGSWVFFGWVCAARDSKLAPRSKKISPKIDGVDILHQSFLWFLRHTDEPQKGRNSCQWLQSRSVLSSFGVLLMSCRVNFHVVRSALQYSACTILYVYNFLYPVLEFALKLIPRSRNGPIFYTPF